MELENFALVHEQAARTHGVFVEDVSMLVGAHVHPANPKLAVLDGAEAVLEVYLTCADGLDLGTEKLNSGFKALKHKVFMKSLAISGNFFYAGLLWHSLAPP